MLSPKAGKSTPGCLSCASCMAPLPARRVAANKLIMASGANLQSSIDKAKKWMRSRTARAKITEATRVYHHSSMQDLSIDLHDLKKKIDLAIVANGPDRESIRSALETRVVLQWALEDFQTHDANQDGSLSWNEGEVRAYLRSVLGRLRIELPEDFLYQEIYRRFDTDLSYSLDAQECLFAVDALVRAVLLSRNEILLLHGGGDPSDETQTEISTCEFLANQGAHMVSEMGLTVRVAPLNEFAKIEQASIVVFVISTWWGQLGRNGNNLNALLFGELASLNATAQLQYQSLQKAVKQRCTFVIVDLGISNHEAGVALEKLLKNEEAWSLSRIKIDSCQSAHEVENVFCSEFRHVLEVAKRQQRVQRPFEVESFLPQQSFQQGGQPALEMAMKKFGYEGFKIQSVETAIKSDSKAVKLVKLETYTSDPRDVTYVCGAHFVRIPNNPESEVDAVLTYLHADEDHKEQLNGDSCVNIFTRIPSAMPKFLNILEQLGRDHKCTVREILTHFVDLQQTPHREDFLDVLFGLRWEVASTPAYRELVRCVLDKEAYNDFIVKNRSLAGIACHFGLAKSAFSLQDALIMLRPHTPRYYSIANVQKEDERCSLDLIVSRTHRSDGKVGVCTGELTKSSVSKVRIFGRIKPNKWWQIEPMLDESQTRHVEFAAICVGAAAFAPARATIQLLQKRNLPNTCLRMFLGVRAMVDVPCIDYIASIKKQQGENQIEAHLGLSGEPGDVPMHSNEFDSICRGRMSEVIKTRDAKKAFKKVLHQISLQDPRCDQKCGRILICGDAQATFGLREVVGELAAEVINENEGGLHGKGWSATDALALSNDLMKHGFYLEDTVVPSAFKNVNFSVEGAKAVKYINLCAQTASRRRIR